MDGGVFQNVQNSSLPGCVFKHVVFTPCSPGRLRDRMKGTIRAASLVKLRTKKMLLFDVGASTAYF